MKRLLIGAPLAFALMGGVSTAVAVDDKPVKQAEKGLNVYEVKVTGMT